MIPSYVYKLTLVSTGQYYYGSRTANVRHGRQPVDDLWHYYFSSSNTIKQVIKQHGVDAFVAEVIYTSFDDDDTYWYEQDLIRDHINNTQCWNKKYQDRSNGDTIFSTAGKQPWNKGLPSKAKGVARSPEICAKISAGRMGKGLGTKPNQPKRVPTDEQRANQSAKMRGRFVGELNQFYGKKHTAETRARIAANTSLHQRGRIKPKTACEHCGRLLSAHTMGRHVAAQHPTDS